MPGSHTHPPLTPLLTACIGRRSCRDTTSCEARGASRTSPLLLQASTPCVNRAGGGSGLHTQCCIARSEVVPRQVGWVCIKVVEMWGGEMQRAEARGATSRRKIIAALQVKAPLHPHSSTPALLHMHWLKAQEQAGNIRLQLTTRIDCACARASGCHVARTRDCLWLRVCCHWATRAVETLGA